MNLLVKLEKKLFPLGFYDDFKGLAKNSVFLTLCNLSQIFVTIISVFFCGHLGANQLDAASLANTINNICALSAVYGISTACDTMFPQIYGGDNKKKMGLILQKSILISIIVALLTSAVMLNSKYLTMLVIDEVEIVQLTDEYLTIIIPSVFFFNIATLLEKYIQAQDIVFPLMVINFIVIIINAALHAMFIFWLNMGISGAAYSVNISSFCLLLFTFLYIYIKKIHYLTWPGWSMECLYEWGDYLKLAVPGYFQLLAEWSYFEIATFLSGTLGKVELGVMSIAQQCLYIFFQIPFGIATAGNIHVGHLLGANKPDQAKNAIKVLYSIAGVSITVASLSLYILSRILPLAFTNDKEILAKSEDIMKVVALMHVFDAVQGVSNGIVRSVGGQLYGSLFFFIGFYVIGTPLGLSLLLKTPLKSYGYFIGAMTGSAVLIILQFVYVIRLDWVKKADMAHKLSEFETSENNVSLVNPNFIDEEKPFKNVPIIIQTTSKATTHRNHRSQLLKRLLVFLVSIFIFLLSIYTKTIYEIKEASQNATNLNLTTTTTIKLTF